MDRALVMAIFLAADARFDPCGAAAFAERLGRELDAGRIVFPLPLVVGGGRPNGCLVLDRFPADLSGLAQAARTLARGLADVGGPTFEIRLCGEPRAGAWELVARAVDLELARRRWGSRDPSGVGRTPPRRRWCAPWFGSVAVSSVGQVADS
jgi:hypothetical protein